MSIDKIGRYQIERELGRGGMAVVYLAHDPLVNRPVAIKVLPVQLALETRFLARFKHEAKVVAALEHPAIVPVYDFGEHDQQPFIVMRYMPRGSLADRLKQRSLSITETSAIFEWLAPGLDFAHTKNIIHRDLKPDNILFDQAGKAYLSDFGLAKLVGRSETALTMTGGLVGTPAYMSPEQVTGEKDLDGRSDIYSMGAIFFQMLTGELPYQADTAMSLALKHVTEPVPHILEVNPDLPPGCEAIIARAMAKDRPDRYATLAQMSTAIAGVAAAGEVPHPITPIEETVIDSLPAPPPAPPPATAPPTPPAPPPKRRAMPGWLWILLGFLALGFLALIVAVGAVIIVTGRPEPAMTPTSSFIAGVDSTTTAAPSATITQPASTPGPPAPGATAAGLQTTPTPSPTATSTPEPVAVAAFQAIPLGSAANGPSDFESPPIGEHIFGDVPFSLTGMVFKSQASPVPHNQSPTSLLLTMDVPRAYRVHLLLNSGNGFIQFMGQNIGQVVAYCDGAPFTVVDLRLGRDVREWHVADNVVSSATGVSQVWDDSVGHIDLLSLDLPAACLEGSLTGLDLLDLSLTAVNSLDPALNLAGITVEHFE